MFWKLGRAEHACKSSILSFFFLNGKMAQWVRCLRKLEDLGSNLQCPCK